jgi:phosphinothricin acetyltransferase
MLIVDLPVGGTIRDATLADLSRIVEIYNAAVPGHMATADTEPVSVASRLAWFAAHQSNQRPLWVLEAEAEILAWIGLQDFYGRPAYHATCEFSLYVAPEVQHQGLGYMLLQHMLQTCPQWGVKTVLGFVFGHNQPSLQLCRKLGFVQWGCLPSVAELDGQWRDLVIMGHQLP